MITNTEISMAMQRYLNNAIGFMKRKGYILPSLLILNRSHLDLEVEHKQVLNVAKGGQIADELIVDPENIIHEYGVAFKLNQDYRDVYMKNVARGIALKYNPDAIGSISACLFKDYGNEKDFKNRKVGDLQRDPEAFRVIYVLYYIRGDKEPRYLIVPYTCSEKKESIFGDDENYDVSTSMSSWNIGNDSVEQILPYPYK